MADERTCYAGDLSSDAVGKTVRVTYTQGRVTSTVEDVLKEVRHREGRLPEFPSAADLIDRPRAETVLFFRGTRWMSSGSIFAAQDMGLTVLDATEVQVLP